MATSTGAGRLREAHRLVEPARGGLRLRGRHPFPEDAREALREHQRAGGGIAHLHAVDALPPVVHEAGEGPGPRTLPRHRAQREALLGGGAGVDVLHAQGRGDGRGGRSLGRRRPRPGRRRRREQGSSCDGSLLAHPEEPGHDASAFDPRCCSSPSPRWPGRRPAPPPPASVPARARKGMVVTQHFIASQVGAEVLWDGGNAVDAAVATAFALAVTHPTAGNLGGGGFLLYRPASGEPAAYDFREVAPAGSTPTMWLKDGKYDPVRHHESHLAVGVPGTVAGLHMAWKEQGKLPWRRLVEPAILLAREGFIVTDGLARSLRDVLPEMKKYPASVAQFSRAGVPYEPGDLLQQPDLARTLERIARDGPAGFYEGETARLIEAEMKAGGGLITRAGPGGVPAPAPRAAARHLPRVRGADHAARQLRRGRAPHHAQRARGLRPRARRLRVGGQRPSHRGGHAPRVRRPRALPRRPRVQPRPAGRAAHRRRSTRRRCARRSTSGGRRSPIPRASSGRRRATTPRTSRWWTPTATRSRSPTPSRTATARRSSCPAPASC